MTPSHRRSFRWLSLAALGTAGGAGSLPAASVAKQLAAIYEPFRVEQAALAPDGRQVAFLLRDGRGRQIAIREIDRPDATTNTTLDAPAGAQLQFLGWATADRLIVVWDTPVILAIEANSRAVTRLADAKTFALPAESARPPRVRMLGLVDDGESLVLEVSRFPTAFDVTLELVRVNLRTGGRQVVHSRTLDAPGGLLLADRQGQPRVLWAGGELPQRFFHLPVGGRANNWQPLDRLLADKASKVFQVTPQNFLGQRAFPLGFDYDPNVLYYASNVGRDTYGIYALDVRTGKHTGFAVEDPSFDLADVQAPLSPAALVFDRATRKLAGVRSTGVEPGTRWLEADLAGVQAVLGEKFPARQVQIVEWDDARERFLVLVAAGGDPGRYFIFHRKEGSSVEYFRRGALDPDEINPVESLAFDLPAGGRLTGYLTRPHAPPVEKPALVVWFHDGPWQRVPPDFQRDAQALAAMGFMVAQINYRGSTGFGRGQRDAIRGAFDRVPVEDALAALEWLGARHGFDRKRVAVGGEGFGGYLALRAVELHPEAFRCAVAINAPLELAQLQGSEQETGNHRQNAEQAALAATAQGIARLEGALNASSSMDEMNRAGGDGSDGGAGSAATSADAEAARLQAQSEAAERTFDRVMGTRSPPVDFARELARAFFGSTGLAAMAVTSRVERLTQPVFFLQDPHNALLSITAVQGLRDTLARRKLSPAYLEIPPQFAGGVAAARAPVFRKIGEFLNSNLYDFDVKIGDVKEKD